MRDDILTPYRLAPGSNYPALRYIDPPYDILFPSEINDKVLFVIYI